VIDPPSRRGANRTSPAERFASLGPELVYLHPGSLFAAAHRCEITTILGSCVSVCLYDAERGVGGANHYLLPDVHAHYEEPLRCGSSAIRALIDRLTALGARRDRLVAKVYGGATVLRSTASDRWHVGTANVEMARAMLDAQGIAVLAMDVGGVRARRLRFVTGDGTAWVQPI
jgi:chemotaxis protein CheD